MNKMLLKNIMRKRFFTWLKNIFKKKKQKTKRNKKFNNSSIEGAGHWYYLRDLLDRLDNNFKVLKHMKKYDPESYDAYSQIGGNIINDYGLIHAGSELSSLWKSGKRPAFGMLYWGIKEIMTKKLEEKLFPAAWYFQKIYNRYDVQPHNGDVYEVTLFYYNPKKIKYTLPVKFFIGIDDDNNITLLQNKKIKQQKLPHGEILCHTIWDYPDIIRELAQRNKISLKKYAIDIFILVANITIAAAAGTQIRVIKGNLSALFTIDMLRTPYFFKDRETTVTKNGFKQKIFHIVRGHKRKIASREIFIKSHFRGLRKFIWNGYKVIITIPGLHHTMMHEFEIAGTDKRHIKNQKSLSTEETAKLLVEGEMS